MILAFNKVILLNVIKLYKIFYSHIKLLETYFYHLLTIQWTYPNFTKTIAIYFFGSFALF